LIELDENRMRAFGHLVQSQERVEETFDNKGSSKGVEKKRFGSHVEQGGDEKPRKHGKFDSLWLGLYRIEDVVGLNSFYVSHLDGENFPLPVNGKVLKLNCTNA
jgi:hypothetical protein